MQLSEFFDYKNRLMEDLLTNERIVHLVDESLDMKDSKTLAYTRVFPYEFIPETIEQGETFICFDVDIQKSINKTFLLPTISVWVFSHKSKQRAPGGGVLTDTIVSEIAKILNGSRMYGLGELDLYSVRRFAPAMDYHGKIMTFHTKEYNRPTPNQHTVPDNRRKQK